MTLLRRTVLAFLTLKLGVLLVNVVQFPVLGRGRHRRSRVEDASTVSVLVPVRDESANLTALLPAVLDQDVLEVIVLDDESADDSRAVVAAMLADHPRGRLVAGTPAPAGWVGKNWACHQLAAHASGSRLLFCDADVRLAPHTVVDVLGEMIEQQADVLSVFPRQTTRTLGEHLIAPLVDDVLLCFLPFGLLSIDEPRAATANGSVLAFTRAAYDAVGGFAAVRGELVEDVALARLVRRAGLKLGLALGGDQVSTRMYAGYRDVVHGFARGLLPVTGGSRILLAAGLLWHAVAYTLPWALAVRNRAWCAPIALAVLERVLVELKTGRRAVWQAPLTALAPVAATPIVGQALRRTQTWKGRVYG